MDLAAGGEPQQLLDGPLDLPDGVDARTLENL